MDKTMKRLFKVTAVAIINLALIKSWYGHYGHYENVIAEKAAKMARSETKDNGVIGFADKKKPKKEWVAGKTLKECMAGGNTIDMNVVRCHNGYFKD